MKAYTVVLVACLLALAICQSRNMRPPRPPVAQIPITPIPNCEMYNERDDKQVNCIKCKQGARATAAEQVFTHPKLGTNDQGVGCPKDNEYLTYFCNGYTLTADDKYVCTNPKGQVCKQDEVCSRYVKGGFICVTPQQFVLNCPVYDDFGFGVQCSCIGSQVELKDGSYVCSPSPKVDGCKSYKLLSQKTFEVECEETCKAGQLVVKMEDGSTDCSNVEFEKCYLYRRKSNGQFGCKSCWSWELNNWYDCSSEY